MGSNWECPLLACLVLGLSIGGFEHCLDTVLNVRRLAEKNCLPGRVQAKNWSIAGKNKHTENTILHPGWVCLHFAHKKSP